VQEITNVDLACRLGGLLVALNPAEVARSRGQAARFKKSCSPQPFVHSNARHDLS